MKHKPKILFIGLLLSISIIFPNVSFAQTDMGHDLSHTVHSSNVDISTTGSNLIAPCPDKQKGCGFRELLATVDLAIKFILKLSIYIAAIMFCYAGFLLVTAGAESSEALAKAKKIALGVVKGIFCIAACYLIIRLILSILGYHDIGFIF